MEDLSSLEGPPMRDERFSPLSPVSPMTPTGTYDPSRPLPLIHPGSISPISTGSRSISTSISSLHFPIEDRLVRTDQNLNLEENEKNKQNTHNSSPDVSLAAYKFLNQFPPGSNEMHRIAPLRSSRSQSALRDVAQIPPRPASADNSTTTPFWLMVNGRLVWIEDMQLWVLWDELDAARAYEKGASANLQRAVLAQRDSNNRNRDRGAWKSLPPLPHEIHHLLPPGQTDIQFIDDNDNVWQRPRVLRQSSQPTSSKSNEAHLQEQWASLAGRLAPRTTTQSQRDVSQMSHPTGNVHHLPPSLQAGYPVQPMERSSQRSSHRSRQSQTYPRYYYS